MSIIFKVAGVTLDPQNVRMSGGEGGVVGLPARAFHGEPGIAGVQIDDEAGDLNLVGWHTFTVDEDDCAKPRIFTGYIIGKHISRGPYRTGASRVWDCDIIDQNAVLGFRAFRQAAAARPVEYDVERVAWALASEQLTGLIADNGLANLSDNAFLVDEANYLKQFPVELFTSISGTYGKNFYAYWDDTAEEVSLYYDLVSATNRTSTLRISNVIADQDSTTFYPFMDGELEQDPSEVYTGYLLGWRGGIEYQQREATVTELNGLRRDIVYETDRIGKQATAVAEVAARLEFFAAEQDTIRCMIRVPSSQVNLILAGERTSVKFTHLPDYESFTYVRVLGRDVKPTAGRRDMYDVRLELSNRVKGRGAGNGGGSVFPRRKCTPNLVQQAEVVDDATDIELVLPAAPTPGNLLVVWAVARDDTPTLEPTGFTGVAANWTPDNSSGAKNISCQWFYRIAQVGDDATIDFTGAGSFIVYAHISEWTSVDRFDEFDLYEDDLDQPTDPQVFGAGPVTPEANRPVLVLAGIMPSLNVGDAWFPADSSPVVNLAASGVGSGISDEAKSWVGYQAGPGASGLYPFTFLCQSTPAGGNSRGHAALTLVFTGDPCTGTEPLPGQMVVNEFVADGDGTTVEFTTEFPYADGSLRVFVDGVEIINGFTETDPTTGTFTLEFAPLDAVGDSRAERVTVTYQGR